MIWNINNKFSYPKSTRSLYNGSRHYLIAGERLPSVTNIISMTKKTEEKEALEKWKRENKDSEILIVADLTIGKGPFKDTYKSDVKFYKDKDLIYVTNIDGPLKHLENKWNFKELRGQTEVSFDVDFELKNRFLNIIMTKSFQYGLNKIADAFEKQANKILDNS